MSKLIPGRGVSAASLARNSRARDTGILEGRESRDERHSDPCVAAGEMVDRGRIELPTPGFSDLGLRSWKYAKLLDGERRVARAFVRWSALECARVRWRWAQNGHKSGT